jgi:hypothetical protein
MSAPSSIAFNVGAPTFRAVPHPFKGEDFRYADKSIRKESFPIWNDASTRFSMPLKTNSLHKPSSNTLNVGGPTFFNGKSSGPAFVVADLQVGQHDCRYLPLLSTQR